MMNETIQMLLNLKMSGFAQKLEAQYHEPQISKLSFEERLNELLLAEQTKRHNSKNDRLIKSARFRYPNARLEDVDYSKNRQIDTNVIQNLASCQWINANRGGNYGTSRCW